MIFLLCNSFLYKLKESNIRSHSLVIVVNMSYNPNYPGGYPNYPTNCGQPAYPHSTSYSNNSGYPATGYPAGVVQPSSNTITDVYIKEDRKRGETITAITETTVPAAPQTYIPPPAPVSSQTVIIEERESSGENLAFAAGMAIGMAAEAVRESLK